MEKIRNWFRALDWAKIFTRLLTGSFGLTWLLLIFKLFGIGYMKNVSAFVILFPMLFYVIASIAYIVLKLAFRKWYDEQPEPIMSDERLRYIKRMGHLYKKPTRIKTAMKNAFLAVLAIIITYLILNLFR